MVGHSESVHTQMHANSPYFGSSGKLAARRVKAGRGPSTDGCLCLPLLSEAVRKETCSRCSSRASKTGRPPGPNPMQVNAGRGRATDGCLCLTLLAEAVRK